MLTANKIMPHGTGLAPVLIKRAPTIELDWSIRQKGHFDATDSSGRAISVLLAGGTVVRGGDVLVLEDGTLVRVIAARQAVLHISHCAQHGTPFDLTRAAYHLGNRQVPIELQRDHLKMEPDHVLAEMLRALHLIVRADTLVFEPEGDANSAHGDAHGHSHSHHHGDDHGHGHRGESAGHAPKSPEQPHQSHDDGHADAGNDQHHKPHAH